MAGVHRLHSGRMRWCCGRPTHREPGVPRGVRDVARGFVIVPLAPQSDAEHGDNSHAVHNTSVAHHL